jgi:hypothetical protein
MRFCAHAEAGLCCTSSLWRRAPRPSDPPATLPPLIRACVRACTARPAIRQVPRHQNSLVAAAPGSEESMNLHTRSHTSTHEAVAAGHSPPRTFLPYALQHRAPHVPSTGGVTRLSRHAERRPQTSCFPGRAQQRSCRRRSSPSCPGECVSERARQLQGPDEQPAHNEHATGAPSAPVAVLPRRHFLARVRPERRAHLCDARQQREPEQHSCERVCRDPEPAHELGQFLASKLCGSREQRSWAAWARRGARRRAAESRST